MTKILVTGGAGMIGSNLVKRLLKEGFDVYVIDNLWRGKLEYLKDFKTNQFDFDINTRFFNIDLTAKIKDISFLQGIDYIFHLADVVAGIDYVFNNQSNLFHANVLINTNTIDLAKRLNVKGFIYAATACSFPESMQNTFETKLLSEKDLYPANPESAYGWSKLMGIYETELLEKDTDIKTLSLILHNVYGHPTDHLEPRSQVIPALIRKAIKYPNEDFIVWGSGKQSRAFVHVHDVVDAFLLGLKKGLGKGFIQIGPNYSTTIKQLAETIVEISGKDIDIKFDLTRPEGDKSRAANYEKAHTVLGWQPKIEIKEGLQESYVWIKKIISI